MDVGRVLLLHKMAGNCGKDIGFSKRAEMCGISRLPKQLRKYQENWTCFVISQEWLWSRGHASVDPVAHTAGRDVRSARLNNCFQDNQSPETTVQLAKLRGGGWGFWGFMMSLEGEARI